MVSYLCFNKTNKDMKKEYTKVRSAGFVNMYKVSTGGYLLVRSIYQKELTDMQGEALLNMGYLQFEYELSSIVF